MNTCLDSSRSCVSVALSSANASRNEDHLVNLILGAGRLNAFRYCCLNCFMFSKRSVSNFKTLPFIFNSHILGSLEIAPLTITTLSIISNSFCSGVNSSSSSGIQSCPCDRIHILKRIQFSRSTSA
jgi:hypothetical protein